MLPQHPDLYLIENKNHAKLLRGTMTPFDFSKFSKKEIEELVRYMRKVMYAANGIGLAANQIGKNFRMFVAGVSDKDGNEKFYAVFNPVIEKVGSEKTELEEGCLSVPGVFGPVDRPSYVVLSGQDKNQKPIKIKAWGLLAKVFQHEVDHLNGTLFIDKAKQLYELKPETPDEQPA